LKENGFYSGPVDGIMSERTVDAFAINTQSSKVNHFSQRMQIEAQANACVPRFILG
jgi:hypothetical protein